MTLQHIDVNVLTVSPLNVRMFGAKDCADLVISIRAMGLLQPLLVRAVNDGYEVIAGQRRLNALQILAEESGIDPVPCMVMVDGDDAAAIEASLAENLERQPMDEVDQYKAFAKLVKEGRDVDEIAATFGITPRTVSQRLALGRLHPPILTAYRKGDIHARDIRVLTMASMKQQKAWWALVKDEDQHVPTGQRLKDWLFGGAHIPTSNALFDVDTSGLAVVTDLFGEEAYFADSLAFWSKQNEVLAARQAAYLAEAWSEVVMLDIGAYFATWKHRPTPKEDGGKVFVAVTRQGEVSFHEGYITSAEAKRRDKAKTGEAAPKPELTKAAQNHVDLHHHAAVRADMLGQTSLALRLIAAHLIAGSSLWHVEADPEKAAKPEIDESLAQNKGQQAFEAERAAIAELLRVDDGNGILERRDIYAPRSSIRTVLIRLHELSDEDVLRVLTFLMVESLEVASPLIDGIAGTLGTDMRQHWQPDETFFALIRDKQVLNAMVSEFAGEGVAQANLSATAKTQRTILTDCLNGSRQPADPSWIPRYMAFPQSGYRGEQDATVESIDDADIFAIAAE